MGCDIHVYVEKKIGDTWYPITPPTHNEHYEPGDEEEGGPYSRPLMLDHRDYEVGRNYRVFAMLAGVRNGVGFANVKTGEPIVPISKPRGLPEDVSAEVKQESDDWDIDGHSHSHFTLAELDAVPWKRNEIRIQGMVDARQFQVYEKDGRPEHWASSIFGGDVREITNDEMRVMLALDENEIQDPAHPWGTASVHGTAFVTRVAWSQTWADVAEDLLASMEKLRVAGAAEGFEPDQLRYVFFFDN